MADDDLVPLDDVLGELFVAKDKDEIAALRAAYDAGYKLLVREWPLHDEDGLAAAIGALAATFGV